MPRSILTFTAAVVAFTGIVVPKVAGAAWIRRAQLRTTSALLARPREDDVLHPRETVVGRLSCVTSHSAFLELEHDWRRLWKQCANPSPFLDWDWAKLWIQHHQHHVRPAIGVFRAPDGEVLGIGPWVIGPSSAPPRAALSEMAFIGGTGLIPGEDLHLLIPAGQEENLAPSLAQTFALTQHAWDTVRLRAVDAASPWLHHVQEVLAALCGTPTILSRDPSPVLDLPPSWADYGQLRGAKWRKNFTRKQRDLRELHFASWNTQPNTDAALQLLDTLVDLHAHRHAPETSSFLSQTSIAFHRDLIRSWHPQHRIAMTRIDAAGEPIAATYSFAASGALWGYQSGWNPRYASLSLGKINYGWAVENALNRGLKRVEFLAGNETYKADWATRSRQMLDLEAYKPLSLKASAFRALRAVKQSIVPT